MDLIRNSFECGELAPDLNGRTDLKEFHQGCRTLENKVVIPGCGGAARRPGFEIVRWTSGGAKIGGEL
jgi:hypothetical protein